MVKPALRSQEVGRQSVGRRPRLTDQQEGAGLRRPTEDRIEPGDVGPPGDGHDHATGSSAVKAEEVAGPGEELDDVLRPVGEGVRRVVATVHDAAVAAPVRFDESPHELPGMACDNLTLPRL